MLAHFAKRGNNGNARTIIEAHLRPEMIELPLLYPVTTEIDKDHDDYKSAIADFYAQSASAVEAHLAAGRTVAVLSEGDPLFYGSYMHLHVRLAHRFPTEVIPGVTAMSGCWSATGMPIVQGDDVLSVLPGTHGRSRADAPAGRHRRGGDHEGRPQPAENPPRAGSRPASSTRPSMSSAAPWTMPHRCGSPTSRTTRRPISATRAGARAGSGGRERPAVRHRARARQRRPGDAGSRRRPCAQPANSSATSPISTGCSSRPARSAIASDNREELSRAGAALERAREGVDVAVVSGGDPGVFAMAAAVCEAIEAGPPQWRDIELTSCRASPPCWRSRPASAHRSAMISAPSRCPTI